jgi:uncharacterized damage-inducible protein DinB
MPANWNKEQILSESEKTFQQCTAFCNNIPDELFFLQPADKWSIAQNLQHLIISTNTTKWAFALPKFMVRLSGGKPNRPSRSFEELVEKYKKKLALGGQASGRYIPKLIPDKSGKESILNNWQKSTTAYLKAVKKNWPDDKLDRYIVPHPLLGRITLRELCYFTVYHTTHHLDIIKTRSQK